MSQIPPPSPFQPPSNYPYAQSISPPRPGVVGGLAITGIVLGSLGVLCNGIGLLSQVFLMMLGKNPFVPNAPVMHDPPINAFNLVNVGASLLLSVALLVFCIGALNLKAGAHTGIIRWSIITLVWATLAFVIQVIWVLPATADFMFKNQPQGANALPPGMAAGMRTFQTIGAAFVWLLWCTLPVLFLLLWRTPRVLAAFGKAPPDAPNTWTDGPR